MSLTTTILGGAVQLTGNPIWIKVTGASIPAGASKYKVLLKVESLDGKLHGSPYEDDIAPTNGEALFNISALVDQPIKKVFQYPVTGASVSYPTQAFNVQVTPGEFYLDSAGDPQESWGAAQPMFQLLKGGSSPRQLNIWNDANTNFHDVYLGAGRFLTHRPWGDFVHPDQPVKLWYMSVTNQTVDFTVKSEFFDGSTSTYTSSVTLNTDSLYEFNCNPKALGLNVTSNQKVNYFDVSINNGATPISDVRRFHYDWRNCERPYFLLFANSIGGIDDVYLSGYGKENFAVSSETNYKPNGINDSVFDSTILTNNKSGQNKWSLNTGPKFSTQMLHLRDLITSSQIWLLYPNLSVSSYSIVPVNILDFDQTLIDRKNNLYAANIPVEEAHVSKHSFDNRIN